MDNTRVCVRTDRVHAITVVEGTIGTVAAINTKAKHGIRIPTTVAERRAKAERSQHVLLLAWSVFQYSRINRVSCRSTGHGFHDEYIHNGPPWSVPGIDTAWQEELRTCGYRMWSQPPLPLVDWRFGNKKNRVTSVCNKRHTGRYYGRSQDTV